MDQLRKIVLTATGIIAALIVVASIILAFTLVSIGYPKPPPLSSVPPVDPTVTSKVIGNYKDLVSAMQAQQTNIFDYVVLKSLLPLFNSLIAAVLTYIFAKSALQAYQSYLAKKQP